jgi:hypothetical protein
MDDRTMNLAVGDTVQVKAWGGETLIRRVVSVRGDTVAVCCEEEYQAARSEGRVPTAIGFKLKDVTPLARNGGGGQNDISQIERR